MKMWSGRFRQPLDPEFEKWQRSFPYDQRLLPFELAASRAHANALEHAGVLSSEELSEIVKGLEEIARRLIAAGRRPDEPAALISKATTPGQRVVTSTLAGIAAAAKGVEPPAMLVVGDVVTYRDRLDWLAAQGEVS